MFPFKKTTQKCNSKPIYGFDIETCNENKEFVCASVVGEYGEISFTNKRECIDFILHTNEMRNSIIVASNLSFDFFGLFFGEPEAMHFVQLFRGSHLLRAVYKKENWSIVFLDTLNYAMLSVAELGKLLGIPKLDNPCLGKRPSSNNEFKELIAYNQMDARISREALLFFYSLFESLGATPKMTLASTAMSLFQNKYLDDAYFRAPIPILRQQFKGYYGGRVEAFARGECMNCFYYDINSLYPSVMRNEYPNPNTMRIIHKNNMDYIQNFEGMSYVVVECPKMDYPLLPYRTEDKLLFPYGKFSGWHTHAELRKAYELGYKIMVKKTIYYKENCEPFREFVDDLYKKRIAYQQEHSPMEKMVKLLMNSLYGKFGQKFEMKENIIPFPETLEEIQKYDFFEHIPNSNYAKIKKTVAPPSFTIPIWASYTASYGRLKLYDYIKNNEALYADTDSILTEKKLPTSEALGKLKLEMRVEKAVIVKPKFYAFYGENPRIKAKGIGVKLSMKDFNTMLLGNPLYYNKFLKFKEALRKGKLPNTTIEVFKKLGLEDTKRLWDKPFSFVEKQLSQPLCIIEPKEMPLAWLNAV